ncbi:putative phosphatase [Evansella vedderi]|uniref:Phosphatase n=1 Tax=Evansella vedderi TaxID=38282 RepID=A0ABT9ZRU1_9BACI|nr:histidine phosphatase family protein [Evansella vedderi]MDQ0253951.1 putative phosphatase [Evansella vedderi]
MELYLIRHGQSVANLNGIIQGHADVPLSSLGKKQAEQVGEALRNVPFDAVYSSDLQRAYYTAEAIGERQSLSVNKLDFIREVGLGPLEGLKKKELYKRYPHLRHQSLLTSGIPGTEPVPAITSRCAVTLDYFFHNHHSDTVAAVSHGGFISIFLTYLMFGEQWIQCERPFIIENTGITKISINKWGKAKFHYVNNTSHLQEQSGEETSSMA